MNLRERAVLDIKNQNLKNWALPVELIDPDGNKYDTDYESGETLQAVQILYDRRDLDPNTGETVIIHEPVIVIALSSLERIPAAGEKWGIKFPLDPTDPDTLSYYLFTGDRAPEGGNSLGFIRIYPFKVEQSE